MAKHRIKIALVGLILMVGCVNPETKTTPTALKIPDSVFVCSPKILREYIKNIYELGWQKGAFTAECAIASESRVRSGQIFDKLQAEQRATAYANIDSTIKLDNRNY